MKSVRIGNDIAISWAFEEDGKPFSLDGLDIRLYLTSPFSRKRIEDFSTGENTVAFVFKGKDQKHTGKYTLTLIVNEGQDGMISVDADDFLRLVPNSSLESDGSQDSGVTLSSVELRSTIVVGGMIGSGISEAVEAMSADIQEWKEKNLPTLLDTLVVFTPEAGGCTWLDATAFRSIVETQALESRKGVPLPCLYKKSASDPVAFGTLIFSSAGSSRRVDILTVRPFTSEELSKDEAKWRPDGTEWVNTAYIYDTDTDVLIPLGDGKPAVLYFSPLIKRIEALEKRMTDFESETSETA